MKLLISSPSPSGAKAEVSTDGKLQVEAKISSLTVAALTKGNAVSTTITLTTASTDYVPATSVGLVPAGAKYLVVMLSASGKIAMGEQTTATCGVPIGAAQDRTFPIVIDAVTGDNNLPHAQSATAGATATFTWMV